MLSIAHNIPEIQNKLERLIRLVDGGWQDDVRELIERTRLHVQQSTPKSKGAGGGRDTSGRFLKKSAHLADGWTKKIIGGGGKDRVPLFGIIWNKQTHDQNGVMKAQLPLASGGTGNYTLLEVLEFGSKPHVILPKNKSVLRFVSRDGNVVFTKRVNHPGTPAFGMVRLTRVWMVWQGKNLQKKWRAKLERVWS